MLVADVRFRRTKLHIRDRTAHLRCVGFAADVLTRPVGLPPDDYRKRTWGKGKLPEWFPTWGPFWNTSAEA